MLLRRHSARKPQAGADARGANSRQGHRRGLEPRGAAARGALLGTLAVVLLLLAGCTGGDEAAPAVVKVVVDRTVRATPIVALAPTQLATLQAVSAEDDALVLITAGTRWRAENGTYSTASEEDAFVWFDRPVSGEFEFSADVESDWANGGEAMVVVFADGESWTPGCLIFNLTGLWQAIRAHSIYDPEMLWLADGEEQLGSGQSSYRMGIQVTEDEARLTVDDRLVASVALATGFVGEGYIGLVKYGGSAPVTFRNIEIETADDDLTVAQSSTVAEPVARATPAPTRTPAPTPTVVPTATDTPAPTNTPPPPFRPATGMLVDQAPGGYGELLIKNGADSDALVILTGLDEVAVKTGYIRAAESFNMTSIRDGTYLLFYSKGEAFSEETYRFTEGATYRKMDTEIPFETTAAQYTVWELTLYGVTGGTVGTDPVNPEDFP